jgi:hypothetical protein
MALLTMLRRMKWDDISAPWFSLDVALGPVLDCASESCLTKFAAE